ncbi:uncharacterized protein VNE69_06106 [Vairimorpha necatrix]|uniref:Retrotransposon gag domain-containing protein n=1 Tax=Vairimorpha necatrix TaxID=6039 RepID=A0AAX4JDF2_9MICR
MNWIRFKEELESFCSPSKLEIGDVFRLKQEHNQTICDYIKLVEESAKSHKLKNEEKIKIIFAGLKEDVPDVKRLMIRSKVLDENLINDIYLLEEINQAEKIKKEEKKKEKKGTRKKRNLNLKKKESINWKVYCRSYKV